jgi:tRNA (guanine37-N1)-methyltransferase
MTAGDLEGVLAGLTAAMFETALKTDTVLVASDEPALHAMPRLTGFVQSGPAGASLKAAARSAPDGAALEIRRLYVAPDRHGEGIGARLLDTALEDAGAQPVLLDVWARNVRALKLYRGRGFATVAEHHPVFAGGPAHEPDLIMLRPGTV